MWLKEMPNHLSSIFKAINLSFIITFLSNYFWTMRYWRQSCRITLSSYLSLINYFYFETVAVATCKLSTNIEFLDVPLANNVQKDNVKIMKMSKMEFFRIKLILISHNLPPRIK